MSAARIVTGHPSGQLVGLAGHPDPHTLANVWRHMLYHVIAELGMCPLKARALDPCDLRWWYDFVTPRLRRRLES